MPTPLPAAVARFLGSRRIAVAGVSRDPAQPANAIFRRLRSTGHEVVPLNPRAAEVEGVSCSASLAALPAGPVPVDALLLAVPPEAAPALVREGLDRGIREFWFHRSFGAGSVSEEAVALCRAAGVEPIVGGCPMMFCEPVDLAHRCVRWWLQRTGRVPR